MNEDVFPIAHDGVPASHISLLEGTLFFQSQHLRTSRWVCIVKNRPKHHFVQCDRGVLACLLF